MSLLKSDRTILTPRKHLLLIITSIVVGLIVVIADINIAVRIGSHNIRESLKPGGGEDVLPKPVQTAINGLILLEIRECSALGEFASDPTLNPRIIEGAWPIRIKSNSTIAVAFAKDLDQSRPFRVLWEENGVRIIEHVQ